MATLSPSAYLQKEEGRGDLKTLVLQQTRCTMLWPSYTATQWKPETRKCTQISVRRPRPGEWGCKQPIHWLAE
eukprot:scaffold261267_cov21-Tisochrysis_lutea.AAC.1